MNKKKKPRRLSFAQGQSARAARLRAAAQELAGPRGKSGPKSAPPAEKLKGESPLHYVQRRMREIGRE